MSRAPITTAIFPVGGMGTRFLPATKAMPKEMLPVVDKPLIEYAVEEARAAGIEQFIFVTGRGKSAIEDHFDYSTELEDLLRDKGKDDMLRLVNDPVQEPGRVTYTRQQSPMGLGHAVLCAQKIVGDQPVAVLLADDLILSEKPCLKQMVDAYSETGGNLVALMEVPEPETSKYGILSPGQEMGRLVEVKGMVEKPDPANAPSRLAIIGRYILQPRVFEHLRLGERGAGGEIQLTDAMAKMIGDLPFHGLRFEGRRFDCGDKVGFQEANVAFALHRADMRDAVRERLTALLEEHR